MRSINLILLILALFALGAACGGNDDDDDDDGATLEESLSASYSSMEQSMDAFLTKLCECVDQMQPGAPCDTSEMEGGIEQFNPENATECDEQVYAEFKDDADRALGCLEQTFTSAFGSLAEMDCDALFDEMDAMENSDPIDDGMETCFPGFEEWSESVDQWTIDHNLDECTGVFEPEQ